MTRPIPGTEPDRGSHRIRVLVALPCPVDQFGAEDVRGSRREASDARGLRLTAWLAAMVAGRPFDSSVRQAREPMTFSFRLEQPNGKPADPPTLRAAVPN